MIKPNIKTHIEANITSEAVPAEPSWREIPKPDTLVNGTGSDLLSDDSSLLRDSICDLLGDSEIGLPLTRGEYTGCPEYRSQCVARRKP